MSFFDVLNLVGGLSLFLFGMTLMGHALERRAGSSLKRLLGKLTTGKAAGLFTGMGVTAIIQSSSATTVMVVGFVNAGLMTLKQAINVIMGANIGTTMTAWVLSLSGISSDNFFISLLKPTSFTPIIALIGVFFYLMGKTSKKMDTGLIMLGFATLMFGMETMSGAVSGLRDVPEFGQMFVAFTNPLLGLLAGAVLTAIIQSSSASVGILQALASTGALTYGAIFPIIMGQNIGTCVTAVISSVGANKNARRAALVHLTFNILGALVWLAVFWIIKETLSPVILGESASLAGIALAHSLFNILCTMLLLPMSGLLERIVCRIIPDDETQEKPVKLDERLLVTPTLALEQCNNVLHKMADHAVEAMKTGIKIVTEYDEVEAESVKHREEKTDKLEDQLGTYLVKVTSQKLADEETAAATAYMKMIGDYERIADHAAALALSAAELRENKLAFTDEAKREFLTIAAATQEVLDISYKAFVDRDIEAAHKTEALEEVIHALKENLRTRHIYRLQRGECSTTAGFIWSDILTHFERVADHCSNISGCILDMTLHNMNIHHNLKLYRNSDEAFKRDFDDYSRQFALDKDIA